MRAPEAAHCSHAYLDKALVIRGEATVSSRRQDPRRWGRPVDQEASSRRDAKGIAGPQKPATPFLEAGAPLRRQDEVRLQ